MVAIGSSLDHSMRLFVVVLVSLFVQVVRDLYVL